MYLSLVTKFTYLLILHLPYTIQNHPPLNSSHALSAVSVKVTLSYVDVVLSAYVLIGKVVYQTVKDIRCNIRLEFCKCISEYTEPIPTTHILLISVVHHQHFDRSVLCTILHLPSFRNHCMTFLLSAYCSFLLFCFGL